MPRIFAGTPDAAAEWEACWEHVLCLPALGLGDEALFVAAKRLVRSCHARAGDQGIAWFRDELADALLFVAEQLAVDPDDPDWQRVSAALAGADAGLEPIKDRSKSLEMLFPWVGTSFLIPLVSTAIM